MNPVTESPLMDKSAQTSLKQSSEIILPFQQKTENAVQMVSRFKRSSRGERLTKRFPQKLWIRATYPDSHE